MQNGGVFEIDLRAGEASRWPVSCAGSVALLIVVFSIVNPPLPVASIVPVLMIALPGWVPAVPGLSLSMARARWPLASMVPDCSLTSTKFGRRRRSCRRRDGADIVEFGGLRAADDLGLVVKLKASRTFKRHRAIESWSSRLQVAKRVRPTGFQDAVIGDGDIHKGALTLRCRNDPAVPDATVPWPMAAFSRSTFAPAPSASMMPARCGCGWRSGPCHRPGLNAAQLITDRRSAASPAAAAQQAGIADGLPVSMTSSPVSEARSGLASMVPPCR